jgi:hypothetical protein
MPVGSVLTPQPGAYAGAHNVEIEAVLKVVASCLHMRPTLSRFVQFLTFTTISSRQRSVSLRAISMAGRSTVRYSNSAAGIVTASVKHVVKRPLITVVLPNAM